MWTPEQVSVEVRGFLIKLVMIAVKSEVSGVIKKVDVVEVGIVLELSSFFPTATPDNLNRMSFCSSPSSMDYVLFLETLSTP